MVLAVLGAASLGFTLGKRYRSTPCTALLTCTSTMIDEATDSTGWPDMRVTDSQLHRQVLVVQSLCVIGSCSTVMLCDRPF